jgi:hypothetical protein
VSVIRKLLLVLAIGALAALWTTPAGAQQYPPNAPVQGNPTDVQPPTQVLGQVETQGVSTAQPIIPFAFTGSDSVTLVRIALGVVAVGGMLLLATRKRLHARYG